MKKAWWNRRQNHERVFGRFLLSYLTIFLVPLLIFGIVSFVIFGDYKKEVQDTNDALVKQVCMVSDTKLSAVNALAQKITMTPYLKEVMNMEKPFTSEQIQMLQNFVKDLSFSVPMTDGLIEDFYLYLPDTHFVVGADSVVEDTTFYPYLYQYQGISYERWAYLMQNPENDFYYEKLNVSSSGERQREKMVLIQSLPVMYQMERVPKLVLHLNPEFLSSLVTSEKQEHPNIVVIMDSGRNILFSSTEISGLKMAQADGESGTVRMDGSQYVYRVAPTSVHGWTYMILTSAGKLEQRMNFLRILIWITGILAVLLGGLLALRFSRQNYKPLEEILGIFGGREEETQNEYDAIRRNIASVMTEREELKTEIGRQLPIIKSEIYGRFLAGTLPQDQAEETAAEFVHPCYRVLYCELDIREKGFFSLRTVVLQRIQEELPENEYLIALHRNQFCLVKGSDAPMQNVPGETVERIQAAGNALNVRITISVSDTVYGGTDLPRAFSQAQRGIEHKLIKGVGAVIYSQEIPEEGAEEGYYYPADKEMQFINCVKISDMEKALAILNEIIEENFNQRKLSIEMARCVVFNIVSTINKVLWDLKIDVNAVFDKNPVQELVKCQSVQEMKDTILRVLEALQQHLEIYKVNRNEELKAKVKSYILQNYQNNNMSLTMVADEVNINASYLSRYFKEQFGENFIDYLSRYRIGVAKKLLEETSLKIQDIAQMVGYTSANNFIRVFKKYEGISPSKYRDKPQD